MFHLFQQISRLGMMECRNDITTVDKRDTNDNIQRNNTTKNTQYAYNIILAHNVRAMLH